MVSVGGGLVGLLRGELVSMLQGLPALLLCRARPFMLLRMIVYESRGQSELRIKVCKALHPGHAITTTTSLTSSLFSLETEKNGKVYLEPTVILS